ncbi:MULTISPECIES: hypothetical protein [Pseudomonas syringae group]|uniref:Uncharacterized protein n=1 Tax=Pseudomonas coronafaciens pv. coronafaciens TaxID=235275 RepID=A0AAE6UMG7_9PSED|nr:MULTISPECIES: hypothetical protein [Pseudomonas syringae group]MCF5747483.1 hypothetical protein [Pseudomonas tremae]QGT81356.1 hypothetical protein GMO17_09240 [Pseudomonas coronafaciens pv. coronafaciens]RMM77437.1 hypothetical protein ALQ71_01003 [Pseudomonas coronafaciens pv. striafaciens]RMS08552.1 hypothetical protein ALP72_01877 [Pseudomonas coronafaciens pv. coronafaciens]UQB36649.1 hypothetical protein I9H09_24695 [Pseudomonas tremae]
MATVKIDKTSGDQPPAPTGQVTPTSESVTDAVPPPEPAVAVRTYRDTLFTSRTLILPDDRTLAVAKGIVTAQADDAVALECLRAHPDLEPLE